MDPGVLPIIPAGATKAVQEQLRMEQHEEQEQIFANHHKMDYAFKAQGINTIQDTYLCKMRNKYTGY
jgi:hypothetical protein